MAYSSAKFLMISFLTAQLTVMPVLADAPAEINYQGRLADASGNPITGSRNIKFRVMDAETGGAEVYSQTVSVTVSNGVFSVRIGSGAAIPSTVFQDSANRWLEVVVAGETLTPRQKLVGSPYALAIANDSAGTDQIRDMAVTLDKVDTVTVDGRYLTLGTNQTVTGTKTFNANISMVDGRTIDGVDISTHVLNSTNVHGIFGSVVGTSDTQTLLNKSISTGTLMWTTAVNSGGGVVFSGGSLVPNGIDFGSGSNDFLDATILSGLTSGGVTSLHSHAGALGESTIGTYHIINGTITIHDLGQYSVGGDRIAASTVTSSHILDNTIASIDLGTDIIASTNIINGSVARVDLAVGSVGGDRIANSTVTTTHILDGTITSNDMAAESVGTNHIIDNSILIGDMAVGAVGGNRIAASTVTSSHILDGTLVNADLSSSAEIDPAKINGGTFQSEYYSFPGSSVTISGVYLKGGHIGIGTDPGSYALYMGDNRIKFTGIGSTPGIEWADGTISTSASSAGGGASIGPGTTDRIARFSGVSAISDSIIYQNAAGSGIGILTSPQAALDVAGNAQFGSSAKSTFTAAGVLQLASALTVPYGGTGATSLTSGGILYGNGTSAIGALGVLTNGQLLIGDGSGAPTAATLLGSSTGVIVTNGAGSIILNTPQPLNDSADVLFSTMALTNNLAVNTNVLVTRGGNVGVGTVSPNSYEKLTVNGNIRLIDPTHKIVFGDGSQLASANGLQTAVAVSSSTDVLITGDDDSTGGGNIHLRIGGTKRMTIFNNGTIGMGADMSSAGAKLDVDGNAQFGNVGTKAVLSTTGGLTLVDDLVLTGDLTQSGGAVSVSSTTVNGSVSFSPTGTLNLPTAAMTANGQLRYNSGALAFRAGGAEVTVSSSTHSHAYLSPAGGTITGSLTMGDGSGTDILSFNATGAYLSLPTAALTTAGQIRYNSGALVYRDGSAEVTVSSSTHTHGYMPISGGTITGDVVMGDGADTLSFNAAAYLTLPSVVTSAGQIRYNTGLVQYHNGSTTVTVSTATHSHAGTYIGVSGNVTDANLATLTGSGSTTLHTHPAAAPAAHASTHASGQSDSLAGMYLTTHTAQDISGAKTFAGGVTVQTTGMTVYSDLAAYGNTVIGDGVGTDVLSFNGTGAYLSLPRAAATAEGQLRYNAGNRKVYFRNDSGELMLSDASHTHTGYLDTTGGTITGSLLIGDGSGTDTLSFDGTAYLYLPTVTPLTGAGQIRYDSTSGIQYRNAGGTTVTLSSTTHVHNYEPANSNIQTHISATSGAHGITGSFVGTTDSQTLTNKTLTSPSISGGTVTSNLSASVGVTIDGVDISTHVLNSTNVHGITGSVVGTSDTQTLSAKTISNGTLSGTSSISSGAGIV
ncbi:MAG TPA: hypothetical protein PK876_08080, partial [Elusimicrobiota bacterium]|nr:hypothetical protein [Elusimicrobiota bacterium]